MASKVMHNVGWETMSGGSNSNLYDFGVKLQSTVPYAVAIQCLMNGLDVENGKKTVFVPQYKREKPKDRVELVLQTQELVKKFNKHTLNLIGIQIIMIEGMCEFDKNLGSTRDKYTWRLSKKTGISNEVMKSIEADDAIYYKNFQLSISNSNNQDAMVHLYGGKDPGTVTNWHVDKCSVS